MTIIEGKTLIDIVAEQDRLDEAKGNLPSRILLARSWTRTRFQGHLCIYQPANRYIILTTGGERLDPVLFVELPELLFNVELLYPPLLISCREILLYGWVGQQGCIALQSQEHTCPRLRLQHIPYHIIHEMG